MSGKNNYSILLFFSLFISFPLLASETIIQKEKMSFETCLKVIDISAEQLVTDPKILENNEQKRIVIFALADGLLKITCDNKESVIIVSTND